MGVCDSLNIKSNEVFVNNKNGLQKLPKFIAHASKSLCKIEYENKIATGFLIKLSKEGKELL